MKDELLALAERCEREQPSYELNDAICKVTADPNGNYAYRDYVNSLDAAMMLVPEGWSYVITPGQVALIPDDGPGDVRTNAATTALALTAAALRAFAKGNEND